LKTREEQLSESRARFDTLKEAETFALANTRSEGDYSTRKMICNHFLQPRAGTGKCALPKLGNKVSSTAGLTAASSRSKSFHKQFED